MISPFQKAEEKKELKIILKAKYEENEGTLVISDFFCVLPTG